MALRRDVTLARINPVCEAFEDAWIANRDEQQPRPDLASYLEGFEGRFRELLFEHLLELELEYVGAHEDFVNCDEYLSAYPDMEPVIRRVSELYFRVDTQGDSLDSSYPNSGRPMIKFLPGDRVGGYELIELIGKGGMGVVFKARQIALDRIVALKMIKPGETDDPQFVQRFQAEAEAAAKLNHIGIVQVFDVGQDGDQYFFSMALVEGKSLLDLVRQGPLPARDAARFCREIAEAMQYAHDRHLLHRDLKPANILIERNGQAKITDFGLAKTIHGDSDLTATGQVLGTPSYMPPEQARASVEEVGEGSDIYSIGAILYHLIIGRPPFQAATAYDILSQVIHDEPIPLRRFNRNIDRDLETICLKCLEKDPDHRYATAGKLAGDLDCYLEGRPIAARPVGLIGRAWKWCKRKPLVAGLSAAFVVSLLGGAIAASYFSVRANSFAVQANLNAQNDRQQSEFILTVLQSVFLDISKKLESIPAAQQARREILKEGLTGLEALSSQFKSDDRSKIKQLAILTQMAEIYRILGDESGLNGSQKSIDLYTSATDIGAAILAEGTQTWETTSKVADAYDGLGNALFDTARYEACGESFKKAVESREAVVAAIPSTVAPEKRAEQQLRLAWSYRCLGDYFARIEDFDSALKVYEQARQRFKPLYESDATDDVIRKYADIHQRIGDAYVDSKRAEQSLPDYQVALKLCRQLVAKNNSAENRWALSCALERLGEYYFYTDDFEHALPVYQESLDESMPKLNVEPDNIRTQLGVATMYAKLGRTNLRLKRPDAVIAAYQAALKIREPIAAADPHDPETHRLVVNSYQGIAAACTMKQEYEAAKDAYESALAVYNQGLPEVKTYLQPWIDRVHQDLEALTQMDASHDSSKGDVSRDDK